MGRKRDRHRQARRIELPSGKKIEVLRPRPADTHSDGERRSGERPGTQRQASSSKVVDSGRPQVCSRCESPLVYPTAWRVVDHESWAVDLRCPNCEHSTSLVLGQAAAERFDEDLERGAETLMDDLARLAEANMAEDVERFVAALAADAIQPVDF